MASKVSVRVVHEPWNRGRPWVVVDSDGIVHGSFPKRGDAEKRRKSVEAYFKRLSHRTKVGAL